MELCKLSGSQIEAFNRVKTTSELAQHGPLARGEEIPSHTHTQRALYLVTSGLAWLLTKWVVEDALLGNDEEVNAVIIEPNEEHAWYALCDNTVIEHTFSHAIDAVLVA